MSGAAEDMFSAAQEEIAGGRGGNASVITILAQELIAAQAAAKALDEAAAAAKSRVHHLRTKVLPDAMKQLGSAEMKLPDDVEPIADLPGLPKGTKISLGDFVAGSLPKDDVAREAAIKHLSECEGDALLKTTIVVVFDKSEHNLAHSVFESLKEQDLKVAMDSSVHPQSLCAFARERMAEGKPIDPEVLGLFVGQKVDVTIPKPKKPAADKKPSKKKEKV